MDILEDLKEASDALRALDVRRNGQQKYRDDLIRRAYDSGVGWTAIIQATGMLPRSLALSLKRTGS